ncbi:MAG: flagellar export protein FliJ [Planctomycetota bacterium]|jgi:flagellar FliJ protein
MAAFEFKLKTVLKTRLQAEEEIQRDLAKLLRQKLAFETELRNMQQNISDDKRLMADSLVGDVDVCRVRHHARHTLQVTNRAQQIAVKMLGLHKNIENTRRQLLEATRQRKAVEILRDKQYERWLVTERRREQNELDEMATQAYGRRADGRVA